MPTAWFHFHPDLNHFLAANRRGGVFEYPFNERQSVKHLIEAAGIPHTEVGIIRANGLPVNWSYLVLESDHIHVYPAEAAGDQIAGEHRFILDNHLGRLATYLRMLGFDADYRNDFADEELAQVASREERILLTRDRRLLMRSIVRTGYCLRSLNSLRQLEEVVRRFDLRDEITPFRRCLRCNTPLEAVSKEQVWDQLEPLTRRFYEAFCRCPSCGQVYWKGSHYEHMQEIIHSIYPGEQNGQ